MDLRVSYSYMGPWNEDGAPLANLELKNMPNHYTNKMAALELWLKCQLQMMIATLYSYTFGANIFNSIIEMNKMYIKRTDEVIQTAYKGYR